MIHTSFVFLLGGHDLEMFEIEKILKSEGIQYFDEKLEWNNALLSQYTKKLNTQDFFVGVELVTDTETPEHYLLIDHHNEHSSKPSSIEQVAKLLDIELTRDQQLVAANDRGYIPAMLEMGATPEVVADIRKRDKVAQGVTDEDERLAEQSIQENLIVEKGITIIKSLTSRFATITDRLFPYSQLLIYTDHELTCYGEGVSALITSFEKLVKQQKAYSGGGEKGFFGVGLNSSPTSELMKIKNEIISILTDQKQ